MDSDSEIAEISTSGRYIRYNEVLGGDCAKIAYKGFDEDGGMEVIWSRINSQFNSESEGDEQVQRLNLLLKPLRHDNVIKYHSFWVDPKNRAINVITESFTSGTLREYRRKHRNVEMVAISSWARQILHGLRYLHSQHPPLFLPNLTCDNIFINGNTGQVKIAALDLAHHMTNASNNADLHSFGMCMVELITSEFYEDGKSETPTNIYKKIIYKVKDAEAKQFLQRCFLGCTVQELLDDPFLQLHSANLTCNINQIKTSLHSGFEISKIRCNKKGDEFTLSGEWADYGCSILLRLRISSSSKVTNLEFTFSLLVDTSISVAVEMIHELDLSREDASLIAELMDSFIVEMVPSWMISFEKSCTISQAVY